jgi:DNA adenine methylase
MTDNSEKIKIKSKPKFIIKKKNPIKLNIDDYLSTIKSSSDNIKYKRISLSPLRYPGGKSKAVGLILENIPLLKEKTIVSPFFGGGSVELVLSQKLGFKIIGYDIFEILVNFWTQLINNPIEFSNELKKLIPDTTNFTKNRHILLSYWDKVKPDTLIYNTKKKVELTDQEKTMLDNNKLLQAVYYYYNMQLSYGPMFLGWPSSVYLKKSRFDKIVTNIKNIEFTNLEVHCDSFENIFEKHKNDFLYLDPPYYLGNDSKMFKGMYPNCNFAIHHNEFDHNNLCELLKNHKGGFILTYNDCPTIREWYKDFKQVYPKWQYTYGQGETRIGKNRKDAKKEDNIKESHEIFIIAKPQ